MADAQKPPLLPLLVIASLLTMIVTAVRVVGETEGWDPQWFGSEAGSPLNPFGIVWLIPLFGFLFGRRLAQGGGRPPFIASFFVPMFGCAALMVAGFFVSTKFVGKELLEVMGYFTYGGPALALLALFAWPRAFATLLVYGLLARAPVVLVTWLDIQRGWQTHYGKLNPKLPAMSADERMLALSLAQGTLWLPFTILLGCGCAALGAATVRRS